MEGRKARDLNGLENFGNIVKCRILYLFIRIGIKCYLMLHIMFFTQLIFFLGLLSCLVFFIFNYLIGAYM